MGAARCPEGRHRQDFDQAYHKRVRSPLLHRYVFPLGLTLLLSSVELAAQDPNSLLVFSGYVLVMFYSLHSPRLDSLLHSSGHSSMTRAGTQKTEAQSYLEFADDFELFPQYNPGTPMPFPRATTELFALDSYQNLIYSMARFKEYVRPPVRAP